MSNIYYKLGVFQGSCSVIKFQLSRLSSIPFLYPSFLRVLKSKLVAIGIDPTNYSGHSFRRGGASFAFALRIPSELIQQQGDWHSDAYLRYLGKPLSQRLKVAFAFKHALQR